MKRRRNLSGMTLAGAVLVVTCTAVFAIQAVAPFSFTPRHTKATVSLKTGMALRPDLPSLASIKALPSAGNVKTVPPSSVPCSNFSWGGQPDLALVRSE